MDLLDLISVKGSFEIGEQFPEITMLVLFGSRAKGTTHLKSDWDFAVRYATSFDNELQSYLNLLDKLGTLLEIDTEIIDLVNLKKCSPLLAFNISKEGKLIYEKRKGEFIDFQVKSCQIHADTEYLRARDKECIKLWLQRSTGK